MTRRDRLAVVQRLMKLREDAALREHADAGRREAVALDEADVARARLAALDPTGNDLPPAALLSLHLRGLHSAELVQLANDEHVRTTEVRRTTHRALRRAMRDRGSVEKLAERRHAELVLGARVRAERTLDELTLLQRAPEEGP